MIPTAVPMTTFSVTSFAAPSTSVGTVTSNSSTSLMLIVNDCVELEPSSAVAARTVIDVVAGRRFPIQQCAVGHGDHAGVGVDGEPPAGGVVQRVGDRVVGRIGIGSQRRDADHGAIGGVLIHRVGRQVAVGHSPDIEFVDIVDVDVEALVGERTVGCCWPLTVMIARRQLRGRSRRPRSPLPCCYQS